MGRQAPGDLVVRLRTYGGFGAPAEAANTIEFLRAERSAAIRRGTELEARVTVLAGMLLEVREQLAEAIEWCEHEFVIVEDIDKRRQQLQRIDAALAEGGGQ